jgi:hypothetical protein
LSLNESLDHLSIAHKHCADVAYRIAEARYALSPNHPTQDEITRLTNVVHILSHDLQALRLKLASGPA